MGYITDLHQPEVHHGFEDLTYVVQMLGHVAGI